MTEEFVQRTNDDATQSKRSAVSLGYWKDPYLNAFGKSSGFSDDGGRKAPEINLGYWTRVSSIWHLLIKTIDRVSELQGQKIQILNLGAGYDTLFWRLTDYLEQISKVDILQCFVDIDLAENSARKCLSVRRSKELLAKVAGDGNEEVKFSSTDLHGSRYHVIAANIIDLPQLQKKLSECSGFKFDTPTLLLSECVLVYIDPVKVDSFLQWAASSFQSSIALINHEQLNIFDKFGQVMLDNLSQRGCSLPGIEACRNKTSHIDRLLSAGWNNGHCWTMNEIYKMLPKDEVERVEKIEFLDEKELVSQLFDHYCVSYGWKNKSNINFFGDIEFWND